MYMCMHNWTAESIASISNHGTHVGLHYNTCKRQCTTKIAYYMYTIYASICPRQSIEYVWILFPVTGKASAMQVHVHCTCIMLRMICHNSIQSLFSRCNVLARYNSCCKQSRLLQRQNLYCLQLET